MKQHNKLPEAEQVSCDHCASRRFAWFEPCGKDELVIMQQQRQCQHIIEPGEYIFMEGDVPDATYTLQEGWVICFKLLANGQRQILNVALAGDFIGYRSGANDAIDFSVMAVTSCRLCAFSQDNINFLLEISPKLTHRLISIQLQQAQTCRSRLSYVGQSQAKLKLAYFLMDIVNRLQKRGVDIDKPIHFPLSRVDIADAIGITSVHLSRVSVELREQGVVDCRRNHLHVLDPEKLEQLANSVF